MSSTGAISHIALSASDFEASKKFYKFLLVDLLGYKQVMDKPYVSMFGQEGGLSNDSIPYHITCLIGIGPGDKTEHVKTHPGLHHLAFKAATKETVDEIYGKLVQFQEENKAIVGSSTILDKPAAYPQYGPGYYA
ncbi:hypothetical protein BGZ99_002475 [Dissophora globulifera]|uniref:VOC domain-containing protein n=1 Tax=Dissophora globulifera TaxID=979702 RepID=A0A9P6RMQ8_9FUNG|nr:hypothetical protein BGZ99_002475 [Dissophora globulifera]